MPLLTSLLILIVVARLLGQIFQRFGQPSIVGEMLAGVLLGPSFLNLIHPNTALSSISEFAVFLVVLSAGLEMNFKDILNALLGRGIVIAVLGFILPLTAGIAVGAVFQLDLMRTVFLGLCVSITALPVTVRILQSFNLLDSDIARYSVATAIFNDVVALLVLGVILNLPAQLSLSAVILSIVSTSWKLIALGAFILGFNWQLERMIKRGIHIEKISEKLVDAVGNEALFGILVLFVLVFGSVSEALGFHFVIGAFFGALLIDRKFFLASRYHELDLTLRSITEGFLGPVFFAYLGLEFNIDALKPLGFVLVVLVVSISSKVLAGWLGGLVIQLPPARALGIGIILNGRGVMELVIASIAYERGFINQGMFSTLVLMGVVTTMMTPLMFRRWILPRL
ncbi:MAG: transporter, CPA2 family [Candidatus Electronema aureum]|jgi:Kef-type K+ transport system membrane component KefB|uniref:Transporter, CPA2 family n=1 Tax=Candidatus Electronema aureum TaxID=2005002 RepID=A0A521G0E9_9BACT|nr:MAG: transporter, CPA2 family [Candidatus Electronema aureum]